MTKLVKNSFFQNSLLDSFFDKSFDNFWLEPENKYFDNSFINIARHPIHISKKNDEVEISFDVPGYDKDDMKISYNEKNGVLSVCTNEEYKNEEEKSLSKTTRFVDYNCKVGKLNPDSFTATCDKGVLTVTAKKYPEQSYIKTIEIK